MHSRWGVILKRTAVILYLGGTACLLVGLTLALASRPVEASPLDKAKATATHDPGEKKPVIPMVCAVHNSDGTFTARFGYDNHNSSVMSIPIGSKNHISPKPEDRGQPSQFKRDEVGDAFQVKFTEDQKITWTLTGPDGEA